jgi:hypothetical protein
MINVHLIKLTKFEMLVHNFYANNLIKYIYILLNTIILNKYIVKQ